MLPRNPQVPVGGGAINTGAYNKRLSPVWLPIPLLRERDGREKLHRLLLLNISL
jgi:hypothetical protein